MQTQLLKQADIQDAAQLILQGQLVAFPTETVYGLGALSSNEEAVRSVFRVKGRPQDNPLIVHVSSIDMVNQYVSRITPIERKLMEQYWPGPLTIVFPLMKARVAPSVSPGGETVAIRMPDHPLTLELIDRIGQGIVGPSANKSGKPSPTHYDHVLNDFSGEIAGVISADESLMRIGVESTVVQVREDRINILRPGKITLQQLIADGFDAVERSSKEQLSQKTLMSPGVKYQHYSPKQDVHVFVGDDGDFVNFLEGYQDKKVGLLADQSLIDMAKTMAWIVSTYSYGERGDLQTATQSLYHGLRYLEATSCELIIAQGFKESPASHAMMDRLKRAANRILECDQK